MVTKLTQCVVLFTKHRILKLLGHIFKSDPLRRKEKFVFQVYNLFLELILRISDGGEVRVLPSNKEFEIVFLFVSPRLESIPLDILLVELLLDLDNLNVKVVVLLLEAVDLPPQRVDTPVDLDTPLLQLLILSLHVLKTLTRSQQIT